MNFRTILLSISLLANAALLVAYFAAPASPPAVTTAPVQTPTANSRPDMSAGPSDGVEASATPPAQPMLSWAAIDTPDIDELARRLKAAGFTAAEARIILGRRIAQLFNPGLTGDAAKSTPYWRPAFRYESVDHNAERRKQIAEQQRLFQKYLMGPEGIADDPERLASAKRRWGDLPVEKLQTLAQIEADYQELNMKQYAESRVRPGESSAGDVRGLLEKERLADITKILSPDEYASYDLRASPLANSLRYQLETFQPTEAEYKTIFAINKLFDERRSDPTLGLAGFKALNSEITAKVSEALGADRALDYAAAVNENSQDKTAGLVSRLGLPARVASEVRQVQQDLTQRAKDIRANNQLAPTDRSAQLEALARQAETLLTTKLGTNGFEAYFDIKGDWLRELQPKP